MPLHAKKDFLILFGSQTGQADAISEEIFDRAFKEGFSPARYCLSQVEKKFSLTKETCVVIVCSTTGEGEPPDTASKFVRRISKKTLSSRFLSNLSFCILALGDSNYTSFCDAGRNIDERLLELGATHLYETGYADDGVGLEVVVEPWIQGLFPALKKHLKIETETNESTQDQPENNNPTVEVEVKSTIKQVDGESNTMKTVDGESNTMKKFDGESNNMTSNSIATLKNSVSPLSNAALKVPSSPDPYLEIDYLDEKDLTSGSIDYPNAATDIKEATICSARQLTNDPLAKKCLELAIDVSNFQFDYQPGDSFGIVCNNNIDEVDYLIERLKIEKISDKLMKLKIIQDTKKKAPKIPEHIKCPSTIKKILTEDVDFRSVPRKVLLRMLVDYTSNNDEKRRLQELCSTQGSKDYGLHIRENLIGLVELLKTFESCSPPIERVLELLPRLLPREYSVSSSPLNNTKNMKFVFNVIELPTFQCNKRYGLCTKWLDEECKFFTKNGAESLEDKLAKTLQLNRPKANIYFRRPTNFRFPDNPSLPLIMIGPGTGVAPFIGFLEHREHLLKNKPELKLGEALLFFGCRYSNADFLYRKELLAFKESGILTDLYTSFSRDISTDTEHTKYVQENIKKYKDRVLRLLFENNCIVYICGDAKHMGRDVTNTFTELIEEYHGISKIEAIKLLADLRTKKKFLEDVWT